MMTTLKKVYIGILQWVFSVSKETRFFFLNLKPLNMIRTLGNGGGHWGEGAGAQQSCSDQKMVIFIF